MINKNFIFGYGAGKIGAGPAPVLDILDATTNGSYFPPSGITGYNQVNVSVANSYSARDEGKVVSGGALVAQSSASVTQNGTVDTTLINSVEVNVSSGGGSAGDVTFYDYDGTIVASYSASDFANLSAMPSNPTHTGLTAQGWNWTLSDAKTYVSSYGKLNIGQMYITDDGKTRIYISLQNGRLSPYLGLAVNGSVDVDWGDGSPHDTLTGTSAATLVFVQHVYANAGSYVITLDPDNSSEFAIKMNLLGATGQSQDNGNDYVYAIAVKSIKFGQRIKSIGANAFYHCYGLVSITISNSVTSIAGSAFSGCYGLASITIPSSVTSIGNGAFSGCYGLASITIPSSVTSIGSSMLTSCYNLASITIPNSVTSIGVSAFSNCYGLVSITIPSSVKSIGNAVFSNCYNLASVTIPNSVTSIGSSMFTSCYNLASVTIQNSVKSIGSSMFQYCYGLVSITIPSSITSIGVSAFSDCCGLAAIRFKSSTPPTVSNTSAFSSIPADFILYVPFSALSAYLSASNYPNKSTYTYIGFATYESEVALPTQDSTQAYNVVWYATEDDAIAQTNPITVGNDKEIYCRYTAV